MQLSTFIGEAIPEKAMQRWEAATRRPEAATRPEKAIQRPEQATRRPGAAIQRREEGMRPGEAPSWRRKMQPDLGTASLPGRRAGHPARLRPPAGPRRPRDTGRSRPACAPRPSRARPPSVRPRAARPPARDRAGRGDDQLGRSPPATRTGSSLMNNASVSLSHITIRIPEACRIYDRHNTSIVLKR